MLGPRRPRRGLPAGAGRQALDVDAVHAAADAVAVEREAELALDVGRHDRPGPQLLFPEAAQGGPAGRQARFLVLPSEKPLVRPGAIERGEQLVLGHQVAARLAAVELLHGLVQRRAVDDRVVRRDRHAQDVDVLVLERAGQVVVHLVEAERERPLDRLAARLDRLRLGLERGQPLQRSVGRGLGRSPGRRRGRQVQRLQHELRDAPRPPAAVVRGVGQDQLVAGPGHAHVEEPPLLLERGRRPPAASRAPARAGSASGSRRVRAGNRPSTRPVM